LSELFVGIEKYFIAVSCKFKRIPCSKKPKGQATDPLSKIAEVSLAKLTALGGRSNSR
jgi:hypothetical protein